MFDIPNDWAVVTSTFVAREKMPILYVSHEVDEKGEDVWQFHCDNGDYDMSKMLLVKLEDILGLDKTVLEVSDLPVNYGARRKYIGDKWTYYRD